MTRLQRIRDLSLRMLLQFAARHYENQEGCEDFQKMADNLEAASAKKYDEDRNGVRRAMKLEDCPEQSKDSDPTSLCDLCPVTFDPKSECCKGDIRAIKSTHPETRNANCRGCVGSRACGGDMRQTSDD